ncbi:MAG: hypothetical protein R2716_01425 [Microthrixaceae bacterium]
MSSTGETPETPDPDAGEEQAPERHGRDRHRVRRYVLLGAAALLLVWLAVVVTQVVSAASLLRQGRSDIAFAQEQIGDDLGSFIRLARQADGTPGPAELSERLDDGARSLHDAGERLGSWSLAPLRVLPVIGRQLDSGTTLAGSAADLADDASAAFASLAEIIDAPVEGPADRVAVAERTEAVLQELRTEIADPDLGPREGLTTPLAEARNDFAEEHARLSSTTLEEATTAVEGVTERPPGPQPLPGPRGQQRRDAGWIRDVPAGGHHAGRGRSLRDRRARSHLREPT